ncbi:hypothetical protein [Natrinema halophilum]|uniref:Superfamily I DNA or RNA helicase n=1 Tax=Natrinema halophilum TaxID=1699371 RepID=A0A7D5KKN5_9EURY|nr:hypothetical protein [Natrinema halophilum]QLG49178.1 hypothetical protein HYG82_10080 [Natrinema halophilum]
MATPPPELEGTCKLLSEPAQSSDLFATITTEYADLADEYGARNVLVLKRHPAGIESVTAALADADAGRSNGRPRSPRIESLPEHASKVIEEYDPTLSRLEYEERIELVSMVIDGASRSVPDYLERAAAHESFARDVGQLLLEATRQRIRLDDLDDPHDCLAFLYAMNDRFHAELDDRGYVERADVIPQAVELLEADVDELRSRITASFDAVLAIEFEEYRRLDRRFLSTLTDDAALVCLGERNASVERTRVEPGDVTAMANAAGLDVESLDPGKGHRGDGDPPHRAITRLLATGESPSRTGGADRAGEAEAEDAEVGDGATSSDGGSTAVGPIGRANRIHTRTSREHVRAVATEIQSLRDRHGWSFDEFAVAVPRIERVPETRRRFRDAGVPTATIGTPSLAEDPAVNELYAVVTLQCERENEEVDDWNARTDPDDPTGDASGPRNDSLDRLRARVPGFSPALLANTAGSSIRRSLERWTHRTDLKGRIAREEDWVDAREQYEGIRRVLEIAQFAEETDLVGPDWRGLRRMLRRTIRYDAPYVHAVETRPPTGGVTVCAVDDLKYDSRNAVFLLDLIDETYPGEQFLTQLFPTAWLREMSAYPAVTDPSLQAIADTFDTVETTGVGDPFETYHAHRSRRRLALGSRAAERVLYCCSYERGAGGLRRTHDESRYLKLIESTPGLALEDVDVRADAAIHGEPNAIEALLDQPRGELERVLREASTGGEADLGETEALFEEIAVVLEDGDVDDELAEAVRSQFEFAAGTVVRDD